MEILLMFESICPLLSFSGSLYKLLYLLDRLDLIDSFSCFFIFFSCFAKQARVLYVQWKCSLLNCVLTSYIFSWLSSLTVRIFFFVSACYDSQGGRNCYWFICKITQHTAKYITSTQEVLWKYTVMCRRRGNICLLRLVCEWSQYKAFKFLKSPTVFKV